MELQIDLIRFTNKQICDPRRAGEGEVNRRLDSTLNISSLSGLLAAPAFRPTPRAAAAGPWALAPGAGPSACQALLEERRRPGASSQALRLPPHGAAS